MDITFELIKYNDGIIDLRDYFRNNFDYDIDESANSNNNKMVYTVAKDQEIEDKIVGVIPFKMYGKTFRILQIYVIPDYREQGIADKMLYVTIKFCMNEGAKVIEFQHPKNGMLSDDRFIKMNMERTDNHPDSEYCYYQQSVDELNYEYLEPKWEEIGV